MSATTRRRTNDDSNRTGPHRVWAWITGLLDRYYLHSRQEEAEVTYRYFSAEEVEGLDPLFVWKLDAARYLATHYAREDGYPEDYARMTITSGFRPDDDGPHGTRKAVDIRVRNSRARFYLLRGLMAVGFKRIGVYDKHIHVDESEDGAPDVIWWGVSS